MSISKKLSVLLEGNLMVTKQWNEKENIFLVTLQSVKNLLPLMDFASALKYLSHVDIMLISYNLHISFKI